MTINKKDITKELVEKALQCKTAEDLMELAKAEGVAITKEEAEAYMAELADIELDGKDLKHVGGLQRRNGRRLWKQTARRKCLIL